MTTLQPDPEVPDSLECGRVHPLTGQACNRPAGHPEDFHAHLTERGSWAWMTDTEEIP